MFVVRIQFRVLKIDSVTGKKKLTLKAGPVFNVEASTRANARPLIKEAVRLRGITEFSIVPAANGDYIVYAQG